MSMFINGVEVHLFGSANDIMGINVEIASRVFGPFRSQSSALTFVATFLNSHNLRVN